MIPYQNPYLTESMTYRDLVADLIPNNVAGAKNAKLPYRDWAPLVKSVNYQGNQGSIFKFFVKSGLNGWFTYVEFEQFWDQVRDRSVNAVEASRLLLWGSNLKLHCNCPSFSYWGFAYILTQYDAAIVPEDRPPIKNNPNQLGWGCKHQRRMIRVLPFQLGKIAAAVKNARAGVETNLPDSVDQGVGDF